MLHIMIYSIIFVYYTSHLVVHRNIPYGIPIRRQAHAKHFTTVFLPAPETDAGLMRWCSLHPNIENDYLTCQYLSYGKMM